ncbi:Detected protein of unknown function [Hibiscus syriacus]|uniref:Uncharacterized protein n=1 Tax=Hibiscus syriacus TaxID=106335 RepID=A0A6A3D9E1_HIBSY|nr:Detected protein of unknown function [Hibiscus syriacus]
MLRNFLRKTNIFCGRGGEFLSRRRGLSSSTSAQPARRFAAVWGNGDFGRLGVGSLDSQWWPKPIKLLFLQSPNPQVHCLRWRPYSLLNRIRGVYATGLNDFGQLGSADL